MKVPVYQSNVRQAPVPGAPGAVSASAASFGAIEGQSISQLGQSITQVGSLLGQRAAEIQKEKDATKVFEAFTNASNESTSYMWDPRTGVLNQNGQNALGSFKKSDEDFNNISNKYADNLENDDQKAAFNKLWNRKQMALRDSIARHESTQFQEWRVNEASAMSNNAVNQAVLAAGDPEILQQSMEQIRIAVYATYAGQSSDYKESIINNYYNTMHSGVINRLAMTDYKQAKDYFEQFKEDMSPDKIKSAETTINTQENKQVSMQKSDEIWFGNDTNKARMAEADKITDNDMRSKVKTLLRSRDQDQKRIDAEQEQIIIKTTTEAIKGAGTLSNAITIANNLNTPSKIQRFQQVSRALYGDTSVQPKISDPNSLEAARRGIDDGTIEDESDFLYQYTTKLSPSDTKSLRDRLARGGNKGMLSTSNMSSLFQSITGTKSTDETALFNTVTKYVEDNIPPGTDPNDKLIKGLMANAMTTGEVMTAGFFDPNRTYQEAVREGTANTWLPDVEGNEVDLYKNKLSNVNVDTTSENSRIAKKLDMFGVPITPKNIRIYKDKYGVE